MEFSSKELSWGRMFRKNLSVKKIAWKDDIIEFVRSEVDGKPFLPYGNGRSYGDSCLIDQGGTLVDLKAMNKLISFDSQHGVLRCEAGATFEEILNFAVPRGWFLPVTPGTMYVTVAGSIANDVHGKNHHQAGTIGCHIDSLGLLRSDGKIYQCSEKDNPDLYQATIGGMGLTGIILWSEIRLKKILSSVIEQEVIQFNNLDEFISLDEESKNQFEYTVSWIDSLAKGQDLAKGLYIRGNHSSKISLVKDMKFEARKNFVFPMEAPKWALNSLSVRLFNTLYYGKQRKKIVSGDTNIQSFFYPLDAVYGWNKCYGKNGFRQFQFVLPFDKVDVLRDILERTAHSGFPSFLTVLKKFGSMKSPGMMSFPREGFTAALDFANKGKKVDDFLQSLTDLVLDNNGIFYPAKDSLMNEEQFKKSFPQWEHFANYKDPGITSSFWRRVMGDGND